MAATTRVGEVDLFGPADLRRLVTPGEGPCVSIFVPTHRAGPEIRQDPIRLRNLLDSAHEQLVEQGMSGRDVHDLLAPGHGLLDDADFWRHQADGLALFISPSVQASFRVPLDLVEDVSVGPDFRIRPLLPLLTFDGRFFVLALSQNQVRLFQGTRTDIAELDPGPIPTSMGEALRYADPEAELQFRSGGPPGGEGAIFHGHEALDDADLDHFLRAVDKGLWSVLDEHTQPLVLACVADYLPRFRAVTRYPRLMDRCIEGNPEERRPLELHTAAWDIVGPVFGAAVDDARGRYHEAVGTGLTASGPDEVAARAAEGRVDTMFTSAEPAAPGAGDPEGTGRVSTNGSSGPPAGDRDGPGRTDAEVVDRAVVDTLLTSGTVLALSPDQLPDGQVTALLRY